jgi:hypothetical protein
MEKISHISLIAIFVRIVVFVFFIPCVFSILAIFHSGGGGNLDRPYNFFSIAAMISINITSEPFHVLLNAIHVCNNG